MCYDDHYIVQGSLQDRRSLGLWRTLFQGIKNKCIRRSCRLGATISPLSGKRSRATESHVRGLGDNRDDISFNVTTVHDQEHATASMRIHERSRRTEVSKHCSTRLAKRKRVRHPKEGTCGPHRADPRFPPSAPRGRPTLHHTILGSAGEGGI